MEVNKLDKMVNGILIGKEHELCKSCIYNCCGKYHCRNGLKCLNSTVLMIFEKKLREDL